MKIIGDIDIDLADRAVLLNKITHIPAVIHTDKFIKHNTGIYVTEIPQDPDTGFAAIDYKTAEQLGYCKLDLLNVNLYKQFRTRAELLATATKKPDWFKLYEKDFFTQLIHIGAHYSTLMKMPEPLDSLEKMAMFLAIIRPAKRDLIGRPWHAVEKTIWDPDSNGGYIFKKSHSMAYSHLVVIHMNLICEQQKSQQQNM